MTIPYTIDWVDYLTKLFAARAARNAPSFSGY